MSSEIRMTSNRPYLIRALYEWIVDNGLTPHLLVDSQAPGLSVPKEAVEDSRIVLNVAPRAVAGLQLGNELIELHARFGGVSRACSIPVSSVLAVYARENGQGMLFPEEDGGEPPPDPDDGDGASEADDGGSKRPNLKVIK